MRVEVGNGGVVHHAAQGLAQASTWPGAERQEALSSFHFAGFGTCHVGGLPLQFRLLFCSLSLHPHTPLPSSCASWQEGKCVYFL